MKHFKTGYGICMGVTWMALIVVAYGEELSPGGLLALFPIVFVLSVFMVVMGGELFVHVEHDYEKEWGGKVPDKWPHAFRDGFMAGLIWSAAAVLTFFFNPFDSLWILLVPFFAAMIVPGYGANYSLRRYRKKVEADVLEKYTSK